MPNLGWVLIWLGLLLVVVGLGWVLAPSLPWLGRLPGDLVIERENGRIDFPITTSILLSLLLTAVMWLVRIVTR